jgi:hypothetical protein
MDLAAQLLVAVPTVFLAAFLALFLENVRERVRTRNWVMRNLRALVESGRPSPPEAFATVEAAIGRWLVAESPDDMDDQAWGSVRVAVFSDMPDVSPILRSGAATAVPADVFTAVFRLEEVVAETRNVGSMLNEQFQRDVLPLWYERQVPLDPGGRRKVSTLLEIIARLRTSTARTSEAFERLRAAIRKV